MSNQVTSFWPLPHQHFLCHYFCHTFCHNSLLVCDFSGTFFTLFHCNCYPTFVSRLNCQKYPHTRPFSHYFHHHLEFYSCTGVRSTLPPSPESRVILQTAVRDHMLSQRRKRNDITAKKRMQIPRREKKSTPAVDWSAELFAQKWLSCSLR